MLKFPDTMDGEMKEQKIKDPKAPRHRRMPASAMRISAERAFSRTVGAPLVPGNDVRLLRDACENYPAWLAAIPERNKSGAAPPANTFTP